MHGSVQLMSKPSRIRVLGSIPSIGKSQQVDRSADYVRNLKVHAPNESQHYFGLGFQEILIIHLPYTTVTEKQRLLIYLCDISVLECPESEELYMFFRSFE